MSPDLRIRQLADGDWDALTALEAATYAPLGLSEGRAALQSRARVSPATCFVAESGERLAGYLLALPYPPHAHPRLTRAEQRPFVSRNLHLHDLAIAPPQRRRGLARLLLHHLTATATAHGYEQISLIAVGGSHPFWTARGFAPDHRAAAPGPDYGPDAVSMVRPLPARAGRATGVRRPVRHRPAAPHEVS
ncbi:GNAT family N-acetyltransferase [Streptomyces sp. NPDC059080]|uniref:GNAT family N-acetyltransferase n=1 Tax=Streptomyces sp. NPDC059080 TaxID=3346718 RepID=UPI00369B1DBB